MKICMPSSAVAGIDHPTYGRVHARRGIADVPDHVARDLIKFDECFAAGVGKPVARAVGFVCTACRFETYFRTCGRCGAECVRPEENDGHPSR